MANDHLGNNLDTTIREHIASILHKMNKADITHEYMTNASSVPQEDLGTGFRELVEYENKLGDDFGNKKR